MSFNSKESYDIQASKLSAKEQDVNKPAEETRGIDAYKSFRAIMTVVDRHRPFEPDDFIKESFIPETKDGDWDKGWVEFHRQQGWRR